MNRPRRHIPVRTYDAFRRGSTDLSEQGREKAALRRFFLGSMSEEERVAFEDRMLADEGLYAQALVMEDELADDLVEGRLEGAERAALVSLMERSPAIRSRMDHAAALHAVLRRQAAARRPSPWARALAALSPAAAWRPALAGALVAAIAVGLWSHVRVDGLRSDVARAGEERDRARSEEAQARDALAAERQEHERRLADALRDRGPAGPGGEAPATPVLATFALAASARSDAPPVLRVPGGPGTVVLRIEVEAGPGELRAIVRTVRGEQVLALGGLRRVPSGSLGVVDVPVRAVLLTRGAYEVVLAAPLPGGAWETLGVYPFEVVRGQ